MFTELMILRAVQHGMTWERQRFEDFDQIVTLCRKLRDQGCFSLDEIQGSRATAPDALVITDFTEAGMARLDVLRQE